MDVVMQVLACADPSFMERASIPDIQAYLIREVDQVFSLSDAQMEEVEQYVRKLFDRS